MDGVTWSGVPSAVDRLFLVNLPLIGGTNSKASCAFKQVYILGCFGKFRYIIFIMYLDIVYI
jgi:hypothetical protein